MISLGLVALRDWGTTAQQWDRADIPFHEIVCLALCAALGPIGILQSYLILTPWSVRYAFGLVFGVCALLMVIVKRSQANHRWAEILALAVTLAAFWTSGMQLRYSYYPVLSTRGASALPVVGLDSAKPLVISNGLILAEANYYESDSVLRNVYYLVDRRASLEYTGHLVSDRQFSLVKKWGALRANMAEYENFTSDHKSFYVYGPWEYPKTGSYRN